MKNPFQTTSPSGHVVETLNAADRCQMVKSFSWAQCQAAMKANCLQATVYQAIQRRLRELQRERMGARQGAA